MSGKVLNDKAIREMIDCDQIVSHVFTDGIRDEQIQPASLDLRLGICAYRVRASFLAGKNRSISDCINNCGMGMHKIDLDRGTIFEVGCIYIVPLAESLVLPDSVCAFANSKSSLGRLDVFTRLVIDNGVEFDRVPCGYKGGLYAEICPRTFSILVHSGLCLNQIRFIKKPVGILPNYPNINDNEDKFADTAFENMDDLPPADESFSLNLKKISGESDVVGYKAKNHCGIIDLSKENYYSPEDFWEPVYASTEGMLILEPNAFYILSSSEFVSIPPNLAGEMKPYLSFLGEFRVHYAGFFDPNFGYILEDDKNSNPLLKVDGDRKKNHQNHSRAVFEVRCHEVPFALFHGQVISYIKYEKMIAIPERLYGSRFSNYQGQSLRLSKHFKSGF